MPIMPVPTQLRQGEMDGRCFKAFQAPAEPFCVGHGVNMGQYWSMAQPCSQPQAPRPTPHAPQAQALSPSPKPEPQARALSPKPPSPESTADVHDPGDLLVGPRRGRDHRRVVGPGRNRLEQHVVVDPEHEPVP